MRLKLFRVPDMAGAMSCVRAELGTKALILATRRTRKAVEITAALELAGEASPLLLIGPPGPAQARP